MEYIAKLINYLNSLEKNKNDVPIKNHLKGNDILNKIKISKKRYISSINAYYKFVEDYYNFNTKSLKECQFFEENCLSSLTLTLTLEELSHILNLDLNQITNEINDFVNLSKNINYKQDIQNFY